MHSGIVIILCLTAFCWVVHLLPVISVPITSVRGSHVLELAHYQNVSYGVFGYCLTRRGCTPPGIGYAGDVLFPTIPGEFQNGDTLSFLLPSEEMQAFLKFLSVHLVALVFTSLLLLTIGACLLHDYLQLRRVGSLSERSDKQRSRSAEHGDAGCVDDTYYMLMQKRRKWFRVFLEVMLVCSIFLFLLGLLGYLVDILLFVPYLSWIGWLQLAVVLIMALICSLVCFMKRSVISRRHLEEEAYALGRTNSRLSDSSSDSGVYIYSNGFTANEETSDGERVVLDTTSRTETPLDSDRAETLSDYDRAETQPDSALMDTDPPETGPTAPAQSTEVGPPVRS